MKERRELTDQSRPRHNSGWLDSLADIKRTLGIVSATRRARKDSARDELSELGQENADLREKVKDLSHKEADARYLATHDDLTGLANRSLLMDRFIQAAAHAQRGDRPIALLLMDVNGLKAINDNHGHLAGDRLLQRVAHVMSDTARAGDTVARYGGDEFVMLLASVDWIEDAREVVRKLHARMRDCLRVDNIEMDTSMSCGIAMYPDDGNSWHAMMAAADIAMYKDKPQPKSISAQVPDTRRPSRDDRDHGLDPRPTVMPELRIPAPPHDGNGQTHYGSDGEHHHGSDGAHHGSDGATPPDRGTG